MLNETFFFFGYMSLHNILSFLCCKTYGCAGLPGNLSSYWLTNSGGADDPGSLCSQFICYIPCVPGAIRIMRCYALILICYLLQVIIYFGF